MHRRPPGLERAPAHAPTQNPSDAPTTAQTAQAQPEPQLEGVVPPESQVSRISSTEAEKQERKLIGGTLGVRRSEKSKLFVTK